jgi:hypothetical protein
MKPLFLKAKQTLAQILRLNFFASMLGILFFSLVFVSNEVQAAVSAKTYEGTWSGVFNSGLGPMRTVVVLEAIDNIKIKGRFIFYPDNSNRTVLSGQFSIDGSVNQVSKKMQFHGTKWITNPGYKYVTIGFSGSIRPDLKTISGFVIRDDNKATVGKFIIWRITSLPPQ